MIVDSVVVLGRAAAAAAAKCGIRRPMVLSSTQKYHISTILTYHVDILYNLVYLHIIINLRITSSSEDLLQLQLSDIVANNSDKDEGAFCNRQLLTSTMRHHSTSQHDVTMTMHADCRFPTLR